MRGAGSRMRQRARALSHHSDARAINGGQLVQIEYQFCGAVGSAIRRQLDLSHKNARLNLVDGTRQLERTDAAADLKSLVALKRAVCIGHGRVLADRIYI